MYGKDWLNARVTARTGRLLGHGSNGNMSTGKIQQEPWILGKEELTHSQNDGTRKKRSKNCAQKTC